MILVDTSVWIDYVNGIATTEADILDRELRSERIATGDLIVAEFLQGFKDDAQFYRAKDLLDGLAYFDLVGGQIALQSTRNYRALRKAGITVRKTIDVIIATFCIENGFELLHADRDFDPLERFLGLRVRH